MSRKVNKWNLLLDLQSEKDVLYKNCHCQLSVIFDLTL